MPNRQNETHPWHEFSYHSNADPIDIPEHISPIKTKKYLQFFVNTQNNKNSITIQAVLPNRYV